VIPEPVKVVLRPVRNRLMDKRRAELAFWRGRSRHDGGRFRNDHFERVMLAMAGENNADFVAGKVVADFGCGPRGSLVWADRASLRLGVDVLADRYADEFPGDITSHGMVYVKSTERVIPIPTGFVDVMFTLNALDHVDHFEAICDELVRVIRPGGLLIGSFNLNEHASLTEPQRLTEKRIEAGLLSQLDVESRRLAAKLDGLADQYIGFFQPDAAPYVVGKPGFLWIQGRKHQAAGGETS
jgi:SAM-dependent methyltransferase